MVIEPTPLERRVMEMLLAGDDPTLVVFRNQFHSAEASGRTLTGVSFFLDFSVPPEVPRLEGRNRAFEIGDVAAEVEGLAHAAGFVLHVRAGVIASLEGFSYGEPWPASVEKFRVSYIDGDENDHARSWEKWIGFRWDSEATNRS